VARRLDIGLFSSPAVKEALDSLAARQFPERDPLSGREEPLGKACLVAEGPDTLQIDADLPAQSQGVE
jgi:hypothetical protein